MRVLRQQIFLSSSVWPISEADTYWMIYHALGNALWNFLDFGLWRKDGGDSSKSDEYKLLRGLKLQSYPEGYQHNIFHIAAEDFRYLFGPQSAGRSEWVMNHLDSREAIGPPSPEVTAFWQREITRYGVSDQTQEEIV